MWIDVMPEMMSDEEPMPDGKILIKRPLWLSDVFNNLMDTLDTRANLSFKTSARKERIMSNNSTEGVPPPNTKDWMKA